MFLCVCESCAYKFNQVEYFGPNFVHVFLLVREQTLWGSKTRLPFVGAGMDVVGIFETCVTSVGCFGFDIF